MPTTDPTLDDVARLAGVSKSTASRILGTSEGERLRFAAKTQEKVRQAAEMLGYTPSRLARGLSRKRTGIVGLVVPSIKDSFFPSVTTEVESRLAERGFSVILANTRSDARIEAVKIRELLSWRVDGLVIAPSQETGDPGPFWDLWRREVPFVLIDRVFQDTPFLSVATDDRSGALCAVEHLLSLGRRRVARAGSGLEVSTNRLRHEGYVEALVSRGIRPDPAMALNVPPTLAGGRDTIAALFPAHESKSHSRSSPSPDAPFAHAPSTVPDALFCFSDVLAAGALEACLERGILVPEDLAIVGYADLEFSHMLHVPLSTVSQPTALIGQTAADLLLAQMEGSAIPEAQVNLPVKLIIRESSVGCGRR